MAKDVKGLLKRMMEVKASDLHITANSPMQFRIDEKLVPIDEKTLSPEDTKTTVYSLLTKEQIENFERDLELDFSFGIEKLARFRVNVFKQRSYIGCAIRLIPYEIMSFEQCGLPIKIVTQLCNRQKGLVLVTGATGSGKL